MKPPPAKQDNGLSGAARVGFAVTSVGQAIRFVTEFTTSVALARLLLPQDFGIAAVVATFLQLSFVVGNIGMGIAIVQTRSLTRQDIDTGFAISAIGGLALMMLCWLLSTWAAWFFHMPVLRLVMPIMATQMLLASLTATPYALLRRNLQFARTAVVDVASSLSYAVAGISLAVAGYGLWALVWSPIVSGLCTVVLSHSLAGYLPRPHITRESLRKLLGFGGTLTVKNLLVNLGRNFDNLVVARVLGEVDTGLYSRAFNLTTLPQTRFVSIVYGLSFPLFCCLRDDNTRFRNLYVKATVAVAVIISPILTGLCVVGRDFTVAVYGSQWESMVPSLQILCGAGLVNCLHVLSGSAIEASGRLRYEVATETVYAILVPVGSVLLSRYGIEGISFAILLAALVAYGLKAVTLRAAIGLPLRSYFGAALPSIGSAVTMAAVVLVFLRSDPLVRLSLASHGVWARLGLATLLGASIYALALYFLGRNHLRLVLGQVSRIVNSRSPRIPSAEVSGAA